MTPKQIEKLMAAAYCVTAVVRGSHPPEVKQLAATLAEVDPGRAYDPCAPMAGADGPLDVSLRHSPRLPRLIGENEAGIHD